MFKLNKMTDYAVVMMAELARGGDAGGACPGGSVVTAQRLAEASAVPQPTVAKLLKQLAQAGLMESQRGAQGGYRLARDASEISVAEIIAAVEGPIALAACVDDSTDQCGVLSLCAMAGHWEMVNAAVRAALEGVTLADMMARPVDFRPPFEPVPVAAH